MNSLANYSNIELLNLVIVDCASCKEKNKPKCQNRLVTNCPRQVICTDYSSILIEEQDSE